MILGLTLAQFTILHVVISLVGIVTGLVALLALASGRWLSRVQAVFLATTVATTLTGFLFPITKFTPAIGTGILSTVILAIALIALFVFGRKGRAATVYAVTATIAQWLNMFVLVVQSFLKVPALNALAPNGNEPPFLVAQVAVLGAMVILGWALVRSSRATLVKAA